MYIVHPEAVPQVEFMHLVFIHMPGESYRRRLGSLLCLCFQVLINSLVYFYEAISIGGSIKVAIYMHHAAVLSTSDGSDQKQMSCVSNSVVCLIPFLS